MTFMQRYLGVFKLDKAVFQDIEQDQGALSQAIIVVTIAAVLAAVGSLFGVLVSDGTVGFGSVISSLVWTYIGWVLWSVIVWVVGTMVFKGQAEMMEMLRVIGFAYAPMVLSVIPCIGPFVGGIWTLIAGFVAVREGLDLDTTKAFLTVAIGFVVYLIGTFAVGAIFGAGTAAFNSVLGG